MDRDLEASNRCSENIYFLRSFLYFIFRIVHLPMSIYVPWNVKQMVPYRIKEILCCSLLTRRYKFPNQFFSRHLHLQLLSQSINNCW